MDRYCIKCGAQISDNDSFCPSCGFSLADQRGTTNKEAPAVISTVKAYKSSLLAPAYAGETALSQSGVLGNGVLSSVNPIRLVFTQAAGYFRNIASSFRNAKKLIPAIVLAVIWVILILLPRLGINPLPVKILSFITFAQGGLSNNVFRMFGGVVGKGLFAYLVTALVLPIFRKQNPFKAIGSGIKGTVGSFKSMGENIVPMLAGAGIALIFFNFIAGYSSLWKSMGAVTASLLALRAIGSNGFMTRLFNSVLNRKSHKADAKSVLAGMGTGFAIAIPISAIPFVYICYCVGGGLLFTAFVVFVVKKIVKRSVRQ